MAPGAGAAGIEPAAALAVSYPEGSALRVATLASGAWVLGGADAARFFVSAGALRFRGPGGTVALPDYERPGDRDGDNRYEVTLARPGGEAPRRWAVRVTNRDEPGRVALSTARPVTGEPLEAALVDPDGVSGLVAWSWARWAGGERWSAIAGADGPVLIPAAADAGRFLRATACYRDGAGGAERRCVAAMASEPVLGPLLADLAARSDHHPGADMRPAFDPRIAHYAVTCAEHDVVTVSFRAPPGTRAAVDGVVPRVMADGSAAAARAVERSGRVRIELARLDGAFSVYWVHCMAPELAALSPAVAPGAGDPGLMALAAGAWLAAIDGHGVPRLARRAAGAGSLFLLPFRQGNGWRFAHAEEAGEGGFRWVVSDPSLERLWTVATAAPLTQTGLHDFVLLADGGALLMAYEPHVGDFRPLNALGHRDAEGKPWGAAVETEDSAIQRLGPDGVPRWTWRAWGRIPLEDCTGHWFPGDYAHVNALQMTDGGVLASFRGCSTVLMLDPEAPPGEEIRWRLGATNLAPEAWAARGLGPPPLAVVGDPDGIFCGQHAARLIDGAPEPRLLMFDNAGPCVPDPATGETLVREEGRSSRVVEYALDLESGEAVFVRHVPAARDAGPAVGTAGGHVAVLEDGRWLVGWGFTGAQPADPEADLPAALVSIADPGTGRHGFSIPRAGGLRELRPEPLERLVLAEPPAAAQAFFPDAAPAAHGGRTVEVAVAFSRPVRAFGPDTASVRVAGGVLAAVAPDAGFGRPANSWRLAVAPDGRADVVLALEAGVPCDAGGICPADGATLAAVPPATAIPFAAPARAAAADNE